jgi:hypothetical protein
VVGRFIVMSAVVCSVPKSNKRVPAALPRLSLLDTETTPSKKSVPPV